MPEILKPQKVAIRVKYKPTLSVYTKMDAVAIPMTHEFPLWERSALAVELRNPEKHKQFHMYYEHCYFDCDAPEDLGGTIQDGVKAIDTALRKFEVNTLTRVGIAQFFVAPTEKSFQDLILKCDKAFHVPFESIPAFDDCRLSDTAYIVSAAERESKWVRTVQVGPMTRSEFWSKFPIDPRLYSTENEPLSYYQNLVPETLVFVSVDSYCEQSDRQHAIANMPSAAKRAEKTAQGLFEFISGD